MRLDPVDHIEEACSTQYRTKLFRKGTDVNDIKILGDTYLGKALKDHPGEYCELWLAEGPRRVVAYIGETRYPWEPGDFCLGSGRTDSYSTKNIRRAYRMLCLGSWYAAVTRYENSVPMGEEENWELPQSYALEIEPKK